MDENTQQTKIKILVFMELQSYEKNVHKPIVSSFFMTSHFVATINCHFFVASNDLAIVI